MSVYACGSKASFESCCGPIIAGSPAPTAEALMRSRYTAFVVKSLDHVERTHAPEIAKAALKPKAGQVITSLSSFLTATRNPDTRQIAEKQRSVLNAYADKTAKQQGLEDFHQRYVAWAKEMAFLSSRDASTVKVLK